MKRWLKDKLKNLFLKYEYHIVYSPRAKGIAGFRITDDLKLLIPKESPLCFDVGANEGQTINLLKSCLRKPRILAFEPSSKVFNQLASKKHGNDVSLHHLALGAIDSTQTFFNYDLSVLSSLLPLADSNENPFRNAGTANEELIQVRRIDTFTEDHNIDHIDLLKIDTQGYDLHVLEGAEILLSSKRIDFILIELNFINIYHGQSNHINIIEYLFNKKYYLVDMYEKIHHDGIMSWCSALFSRKMKEPRIEHD